MKKLSKSSLQSILLAVFFCFGFIASYYAYYFRQSRILGGVLFISAIVFDVGFIIVLYIRLKRVRKAIKNFAVKMALKAYRFILKIKKGTKEFFAPKGKVVLKGSDERHFVFEVRTNKAKTGKKLKLPKFDDTKTSRELIRYAYMRFLYYRVKNVSPSMTATEIGCIVAGNDDEKSLFSSYNGARYDSPSAVFTSEEAGKLLDLSKKKK